MYISINHHLLDFDRRLEAAARGGDLETLFRETGFLRSIIAESIKDRADRFGKNELVDFQAQLNTELDERLQTAVKILIEKRTQALAEQAERDPLTMLFNRASFDRRLRDEIERSRRYQRDLSLVLFDIDRFKSVNDRFGHPTGDQVLLRVAGVLQSSLRQSDSAFRYGGDEFAALCPETPRAAIESGLKRIELNLREYCVEARLGDHFGVSWGVASFPNDALDASELIEVADARLYDCKKAHHLSYPAQQLYLLEKSVKR